MAIYPLRKLLVLGLNEAMAGGLFTLDPKHEISGHAFVPIAGRDSVVLWRDIGFGELRLSVWWDYDHARHPQAEGAGRTREAFVTSMPLAKRSLYPGFVGATVSGWVERATGWYIQGTGRDGLFDTYVRRAAREALAALPKAAPLGFAATGRFFP